MKTLRTRFLQDPAGKYPDHWAKFDLKKTANGSYSWNLRGHDCGFGGKTVHMADVAMSEMVAHKWDDLEALMMAHPGRIFREVEIGKYL